MFELTKSIKCENSPSHDSYHNIICQKQNIGELWVEKGYRIDENGVKSKSLTVFRYIVAFIWKGVTVFKKFEVDGNFVDSTWKTNYCTYSEETYETSRDAKKSALWYLEDVFGSISKIERVGCTYKRIFHHSEVFTMISKERVYNKQSGYTSEIATMRDPNGNLEEWNLTFDTGHSWELVHVNDADISGYDDSWQNPRYTPVEETPVEETTVEETTVEETPVEETLKVGTRVCHIYIDNDKGVVTDSIHLPNEIIYEILWTNGDKSHHRREHLIILILNDEETTVEETTVRSQLLSNGTHVCWRYNWDAQGVVTDSKWGDENEILYGVLWSATGKVEYHSSYWLKVIEPVETVETPVEETTVEETLKVGSRVRHIECKVTGLIKEVSIDHGDTLYGVHWDDEYWMYGFYKIECLELETPVETAETTQTNNQSTTEEPSQVTPQPEEPTMAQPTKIIVVTYHSYIQKWFSFTPENMESILLDFDNIVEIQIIEQGE